MLKNIFSLFFLLSANLMFSQNNSIRTVIHKDYKLELDLTKQVLELNIVDKDNNADLVPTLKKISSNNLIISASLLMMKAKNFDDGLIATLEKLYQAGDSAIIGKKQLIALIYEQLRKQNPTNDNLRALLMLASSYSNAPISDSKDIEDEAKRMALKFEENQAISKPISFYTWDKTLEGIFRQDRLLQTPLRDSLQIEALGKAIAADKTIEEQYRKLLYYNSIITNPAPAEYTDLTKIDKIRRDKTYCFLPPSRSHETELFKSYSAKGEVSENFSLIDSLIKKIQTKEINLKPDRGSGFYDYQMFACEPFVLHNSTPEATKLNFTKEYSLHVLNLFKAALALTRETHIKNLEIPTYGSAYQPESFEIQPQLTIEPLVTYFLRRAESYKFIFNNITRIFGEPKLRKTFRQLKSGTSKTNLFDELNEMEAVFNGIAHIAASEIGLNLPEQSMQMRKNQNEKKIEFTKKWLNNFFNDSTFTADNRMMVPLYKNEITQKTKVLAFLGFTARTIKIRYANTPSYQAFDKNGAVQKVSVKFMGEEKTIISPVVIELEVSKLLNRAEFQKLCDKHKTQAKIVEALNKL